MKSPLRLFRSAGPLSPRRGRRPTIGKHTRPTLEGLEGRALLATATWKTAGGGDWDNPANWDIGRVPGAGDVAALPLIGGQGYAVSHSQAAVDTGASTITASNGVSITVSNGTLGASTITADALTVTGAGTVDLINQVLSANNLTINGGTLDVVGTGQVGTAINVGSLTLTGAGTIRVHTGGGIAGAVNASLNTPAFVNNGGYITVETLADPLPSPYDATLSVPNGFTNKGVVTLNAQRNNSTATLSVGTALTNSGQFLLNQTGTGSKASLNFSGPLTNVTGGAIIGSGTVNTPSLDNASGAVFPGGFSDTGVIAVTGSYTQGASGTLAVSVGKGSQYTNAGLLYSQLSVSSGASLGGRINLNPINGFTLNNGTTFDPVTAGNVGGGFASSSLALTPTAGVGTVKPLTILNTPTDVLLTNPAAPQLVFQVGTDGQVYDRALDASGAATGPFKLLKPGQVLSFSAVRLGTGYEVFAIGTDNALYALKVDAAGNAVGGYTATAPGSLKSVTAGLDAAGRPIVFAVGTDVASNNNLYELKFDANGNATSSSLSHAAYGAFKLTFVTHAANGNPLVYAVGDDGQVYAFKLDPTGTPVNGVYKISYGPVNQLVVGHDAANTPLLFVVGIDGYVYGHQLDASGASVGPYYFVGGPVSSISTANDASNNPELFAVGTDKAVYYHKLTPTGAGLGNFLATASVPGGTVAVYATSDPSGNGHPIIYAVAAADSQVYAAPFDASGNFTPGSAFSLTATGKARSLVLV